MYLENKNDSSGLIGEARIGLVKFSKTGKSIHYNGRTFHTLSGYGFKANYYDVDSGEYYWISGCKKDGGDRLYGERLPIYIDDDIREEYWTEIRNLPGCKDIKVING
jgi:hypothetical protein